MSKYKNDKIKKIFISDFSVWGCDDEVNLLDEMITNGINSSEGVYVYRHYTHLLEENNFIKWLKNETGLIHYRQVSLEFIEDNIIENFVPRNNESVYYLEINKNNKENFIKHFKISIRDVRNRMEKIKIKKYLEKNFYVDDPLYDQYDFIFTLEDQVVLFTDIHNFSFVNAEV